MVGNHLIGHTQSNESKMSNPLSNSFILTNVYTLQEEQPKNWNIENKI